MPFKFSLSLKLVEMTLPDPSIFLTSSKEEANPPLNQPEEIFFDLKGKWLKNPNPNSRWLTRFNPSYKKLIRPHPGQTFLTRTHHIGHSNLTQFLWCSATSNFSLNLENWIILAPNQVDKNSIDFTAVSCIGILVVYIL